MTTPLGSAPTGTCPRVVGAEGDRLVLCGAPKPCRDHRPVAAARPWKLIKVGVRYCIKHDGVANEDDNQCDFGRIDDAETICVFRELYRKQRR
jgi:hypothetical protein